MKENEFDIYVRDLMAGAEESVSPDVWKGVEAGLDKAAVRRRVPVWVWRGIAGVAAAAAVAAGVFFLVPEQNLSNQPTIQTVAQATDDEPLPADSLPEEDIVPVEKQASRLQGRYAYVLETPVVEMPDEPVTATATTETETQQRQGGSIIAPARSDDHFSADDEALRKLAFEEHKTHRRGHYSVGIAGNLQSNTRPQSPASTIRRSAGMYAETLPSQPGIFGEHPEFSFGLPFSAGVSFRYDFSPRWGIGTGIVYTNLTRSFMAHYMQPDMKPVYDREVTNQQHYLGIPLDVYFNIVNTGFWNVHVRMGGMAEKLIDNHFLIQHSAGDIHLHEKVDPLQFSTGVGVGLEFKFTPYLGIYLDPTLRYYFDNGQPRSLRTIQPLRFGIEAGLRFTLGR